MNEEKRTFSDIDPAVIRTLTKHANEIVVGSYRNVEEINRLTDKNRTHPDLAELAETFGMMSVKIEAREYALEQTIDQLRKKNEVIASLNYSRSLLSTILVSVILLITVYIFILGLIQNKSLGGYELSVFLTRYPVIELASIAVILRMVFVSRLTLKDFGVTRVGLRRSVIESLLVTALIILLLIAFKSMINHYYPGVFREKQLFDWSYFGITYVTYFLVAPLQEFLARGAVQGILARLLDLPYKGFIAILVTTFIFGAMHVMTSMNLSLASFVMGWIWGWMYLRHNNLAGVSISHILVGNISGLMGFWEFF